MLENILRNYASFPSSYMVFTDNVCLLPPPGCVSIQPGMLHAEHVLCCLCLIFTTKLNLVPITVNLEYGISSSSKVRPSQRGTLPPSTCNTLQEARKEHLLFYFHRSSYSPARWYRFVLYWPETNTVLLLYEIPEGINGFLE